MRESAYKKAIVKSKPQEENMYYDIAFHLKLFANIQNHRQRQTNSISSEAKNK